LWVRFGLKEVLIIDVLDQWRSHNQDSVELDDFAADDLEESGN